MSPAISLCLAFLFALCHGSHSLPAQRTPHLDSKTILTIALTFNIIFDMLEHD